MYTLSSIDYYRSPEISKKKSPDGTPLPFKVNKLGWLRVGSLLEILERKDDWLKVRNTEGENVQGWVQRGAKLTFSDPRLYFQLKAGERSFVGYCIFNVNSDCSGGYVAEIEFNDNVLGGLELDLSKCSELEFAGDKVRIILKKEGGKTEEFSGNLGSRDCYLVSTLKIKLNQTTKGFKLKRIR
ncbi:MAG: hypothetical protein V3R28_03800 [Desulfatiglandales bacterium]